MDWNNIIIAASTLIGTLGGLWLGNHLSSKSHIIQFKIQTNIQIRKEQLDLLVNYVAEFIAETNNFKLFSSEERKTKDEEMLRKTYENMKMHAKRIKELNIKIQSLLKRDGGKQSKLQNLLRFIQEDAYAETNNNKQISLMVEAQDLIAEIYQSELNNLLEIKNE